MLLASPLIAAPAQAADVANPAVPAVTPDVSGVTKPAETAIAAEAPKADEAVKPKPTSHSSTTIGIETFKDTTVPGQEVSQLNIPLGFSVETENTTFEISIPYIQRTAPSGKIASSEHHESKKKDSAAATPAVSTSGLGDITTSLMLTMLHEKDAPFSLYAKGKVKLATADLATGLGTGQNDYSGELGAKKTIGDFTGSASIGYAVLGSPGDVKINDVKKSIYFNNIYYGSIGGDYQLSESLHTGMHLDLGQAAETDGYEQRDLTVGLDFEFATNKSLHIQMMKSLTPGLSLWGAGASISTTM